MTGFNLGDLANAETGNAGLPDISTEFVARVIVSICRKLDRDANVNDSNYESTVAGMAINSDPADVVPGPIDPDQPIDVGTKKIRTSVVDGDIVLEPNGNGGLIAESSSSTAVGTQRGINAVDLQLAKALPSQSARGAYSFLGAGKNNSIPSTLGQYSGIVAGQNGRIDSGWSFIGSGLRNWVAGIYSSIVSGQWNIAGRQFATNFSSGIATAGVGGGQRNAATGSGSVIAGGNSIQTVGLESAALGGGDCNVLGDHGIGLGGQRSVSIGTNAAVGGLQNYAVGNNSLAFCTNNVVTGNNSVALGGANWSTGANALALCQGGWAAHNNATVLGHNARTTANFDVVVGNDGNNDKSPDAVSLRVAGDNQSIHLGRTSDQPAADVSQAVSLFTAGTPGVFTVPAAPATNAVVTVAGTFPAASTQDVAVYSTASSGIVFDEPHTIPTGTALFTVGTCLAQRFTFSQPCSFYDVAGPAKAIQLFTAAGAGYYFWFSVYDGTNTQTDPGLTGTGIQVFIGLTDTPAAADVATEFYNSVSILYGIFNATNNTSAQVKVYNFIPGVASAATISGSAAAMVQTQAGVAGTTVNNGVQCTFPTGGIALSDAGYPAGLTRGVNYYVVNSTGTSFNLALTPGGTPITVGGFQDTVSDMAGNNGFSHRLTFNSIVSGQRYFAVNLSATTFALAYAFNGPAIPFSGTPTGSYTAVTKTFHNASATNRFYFHTTNVSNQSKAISFRAPPTLTVNKDYDLPLVDGSAGQMLGTNGAGVMAWQSACGSGAKSSAADAGFAGQLSQDGSFLYVCVVAGSAGAATWMKTALSASA